MIIRNDELSIGESLPWHDGDACYPEIEAQALAITKELFPGPLHVEIIFDPSEPDRKWRVIEVQAKGTIDEIFATEMKWHERMLQALGPDHVWRYSISVMPAAP